MPPHLINRTPGRGCPRTMAGPCSPGGVGRVLRHCPGPTPPNRAGPSWGGARPRRAAARAQAGVLLGISALRIPPCPMLAREGSLRVLKTLRIQLPEGSDKLGIWKRPLDSKSRSFRSERSQGRAEGCLIWAFPWCFHSGGLKVDCTGHRLHPASRFSALFIPRELPSLTWLMLAWHYIHVHIHIPACREGQGEGEDPQLLSR